MRTGSFEETVELILKEDARYDYDAYFFVREALDFTVNMLKKPVTGPGRHVSGAELMEGMRAFALEQFGPLSKRVLNTWGIHGTSDFGEIVFHLVEKGELGKTESDTRQDFAGGFDFNEAFVRPFQPRAIRTGMTNRRKRGNKARTA